jgi:hypothetical protein
MRSGQNVGRRYRDIGAISRQRFGHLCPHEGHQLIPYLAAKVPGLRRVSGVDKCAQLHGSRVGVDDL